MCTAEEKKKEMVMEEEPTMEIPAEATSMHNVEKQMICPIIIRMGARTSRIFDKRVEMGDFNVNAVTAEFVLLSEEDVENEYDEKEKQNNAKNTE